MFVFALLIGNCLAQEKMWESLKIDNELEILFPEKYTSSPVGNRTIYRCRLADSTVTLSFIEVDLAVSGLTGAQMDEQASTKKFWDDFADNG